MKCPRCGADNSPEAEWCYLCELPLKTSDAGESKPEAPTDAGAVPPAPIPAGQQPGGPAITPGAYPPGYPAAPPRKSSRGIKILAGMGVAIIIIAIIGAVFFFGFAKTPTIKVSTPPGWEPAGEEAIKNFEELSSQGGEEIAVDYLFTDGTLANMIVIGHGKAYLMDAPKSESHEDVEDFYSRHEAELMDMFESIYEQPGISFEVTRFDVVRMSCDISALHMIMSIQAGTTSFTQEILLFTRNNTEFSAFVQTTGVGDNQEDIDFLMENISFE